jgi:hypothetical protein
MERSVIRVASSSETSTMTTPTAPMTSGMAAETTEPKMTSRR